MSWQLAQPTTKELSLAAMSLAIALGGAFVAASLTGDQELFRLAPHGGGAHDTFRAAQRLDLHRAFFTAWAALILVTPALCILPFRRRSETAGRYWLAFWTASFIAFSIHFYWAFSVLFENNWDRILQASARVSAPRIDIVVFVWWGIDVLVAWLVASEVSWIRIERVLVHLAVFVLFFLGSAWEGELFLSKALGFGMGAAVVTSWLYRVMSRRRALASFSAGH